MKKLFLTTLLVMAFSTVVFGQEIIELGNSQSMCITGKGVGQDAAKNPYANVNSFAIVENIGANPFSIRVQKEASIIKEIVVNPNETKKVILLKAYELYFDSEKPTKAKVSFEKAKAY
jgi:hypothetical protein